MQFAAPVSRIPGSATPAVAHWDYRGGIHAPAVSDADASAAVSGGHALVIRFYSDAPLRDLTRCEPDAWGDLVARRMEPFAKEPAYSTNNWGTVYGQAYVLPAMETGRKDAAGRRIFRCSGGEFVVGCTPGCPERPCRVFICSPSVEGE